MSKIPSIHDAYGGFGQPSNNKILINQNSSNNQIQLQNKQVQTFELDKNKYPTDASHSNYPTKIRCPKCNNITVTRMQSELGTAAWLWCVLLSPFGCVGLSCLCIQSCRDKIHYCTRCGQIVGKKFAKSC